MIKANDIEMVKLGGMTPEERERYEKNKIEINKKVSSLIAEATKNAKLECCILCSKPCSSFCNSHSIPQFALKRIAEDGKVMLPLQDEILTIGKDTGVNKAGTFHIICRDCDSRTFQLYEDPNAYNSKPTDQMLAQIALKDVLLMISKRNQEREQYNDDQLAAINYLVFSYTENVFMNPTTHKELRKNDLFMDMCRKSTDFRSHTPFPLDDPLEAAVKEFSLSKRNEIPNLLSREYALN